MGWHWHQLDHMQVICTSLQTDNHDSPSSLSFLQAGWRCSTRQSCRPTSSVEALKALRMSFQMFINVCVKTCRWVCSQAQESTNCFLIAPAACSVKRNASVWCLSVCLSVPSDIDSKRLTRVQHRRVQRTYSARLREGRYTCSRNLHSHGHCYT